MMTFAVGFLSLVAVTHAGSGQDISVNGVSINFLGQSGKMKFCPTGECNQTSMTIFMNKLVEMDQSGQKTNNKVPSFASQDFDWSTPDYVDVNGVNATRVQFTSTVKVGSNSAQAPTASFAITTLYFQQNTTMTYGNSTLDIPANSFKFTVDVADWPFLDPSNSLSFGVKVDYKSSSAANATEETSVNQTEICGGVMCITSPLNAIVDGVDTIITSTLESNNPGTVEVGWTFPYFNNTLVYDPTINLASGTGTGTAPAESTTVSTTLPPTSGGTALSSISTVVSALLPFIVYLVF